MQVSVETTSNLGRRLTVGVPASVINQEVAKRLQEAAKTVRLNGFRKGKVPFKVVQQKFGAGVRQEVLGDTISRSLDEAFRKENLRPAGQPQIEATRFAEGQDFEYVATFEIFPEIVLKDIEGVNVQKLDSDITEADIDEMIETLRKSQAKWSDANRPAQMGDRVGIDFEGKKDGEIFEGGSAQNYVLELGSNTMIPGFEDALVGMSVGGVKEVPLTFPENYQVDALKGAPVVFKLTLNSVTEQVLPDIDEDFFISYGVKDGGYDKFRLDVNDNMEREKQHLIKNRVKQQVLDELLKVNNIDVPNALVANEIDALRQQAVQQFGQRASQLDVKSLLPDDLFRARAERRTALGLLISEVVTRDAVKIDKDRVRSLVESIASTYEDPQSVVSYYYSNQELLSGVQAVVLEDQVVDLLLEKATIVTNKVSYQELVKQANQNEVAE